MGTAWKSRPQKVRPLIGEAASRRTNAQNQSVERETLEPRTRGSREVTTTRKMNASRYADNATLQRARRRARTGDRPSGRPTQVRRLTNNRAVNFNSHNDFTCV